MNQKMNNMEQYISKSNVLAEIQRRINEITKLLITPGQESLYGNGILEGYVSIYSFINALEAKDPYEQCIQHDSIKGGIKAHAETYSFNIESKLFNQLTKEQQELWRKEIEQACISGGEAGVELARDTRYKENLEVKKQKNS